MNEILTVTDVAEFLKLSKTQVYELTRERARIRQSVPLPVIRIGTNLRFRKSAVEQWLLELESKKETIQ